MTNLENQVVNLKRYYAFLKMKYKADAPRATFKQ